MACVGRGLSRPSFGSSSVDSRLGATRGVILFLVLTMRHGDTTNWTRVNGRGGAWRRFDLGEPGDFHYLNQSSTVAIDGVVEAKEFSKLVAALGVFRIPEVWVLLYPLVRPFFPSLPASEHARLPPEARYRAGGRACVHTDVRSRVLWSPGVCFEDVRIVAVGA